MGSWDFSAPCDHYILISSNKLPLNPSGKTDCRYFVVMSPLTKIFSVQMSRSKGIL